MSIREAKKLAKIYPLIIRVPEQWFSTDLEMRHAMMQQMAEDLRARLGAHYLLFVLSEDRPDVEFVSLFNGKGYKKLLSQFSDQLRQWVGKHP